MQDLSLIHIYSRYRGSLDGEPEAAAGADPKENAEKQPERSYIPEERCGRGHGSKNTGKKIAALVMSGILFGCVAGGTMVGVNALSNRLLPGETAQETIGQVSQETQADAGTKTQTSIGNDVSSIVEKAMPSVVAINNKMIYTQDNWLFGQQQYEVPSSGSGIIAGPVSYTHLDCAGLPGFLEGKRSESLAGKIQAQTAGN